MTNQELCIKYLRLDAGKYAALLLEQSYLKGIVTPNDLKRKWKETANRLLRKAIVK